MSISIHISVHSGSYKNGLELVRFMTENSMIFLESINNSIHYSINVSMSKN